MSFSRADREFDNLSDDVTQFDPTDGSPLVYIGRHADPDAADDDPNWIIQKLLYNGTVVSKIIKKKGAWTDRASLFS